MQRSGKNHGGYFGESIDIAETLRGAEAAAQRHGLRIESLPFADGYSLLAFTRPTTSRSPSAPFRLYLSTGIHGDEPAGPLAVRELLQENSWPAQAELWLCPCLNPTGFPLNRRESAAGADLNRDYKHLETPEVRAHIGWLKQQPRFDLTLCLHEDWEAHGFYLYELNPDRQRSFAEEMIRSVSAVCPVDPSPMIEDRPAQGGIIRPDLDPNSRPRWPEAFYLLQNHTRLSYTLEAPSDFPLATRVHGLVAAVQTVLRLI